MARQDPPHALHGEGDRPAQPGGGGASTIGKARALRKELSLPEVLLWQRLRRRQGGARFRRQHPLGSYVLDFYCPDAKLVIEIDGEIHNRGEQPAHDIRRDAALRDRGLRIIRIAVADVLRDPDEIAEAVARAAKPLHHPAAPGGPPPHAMHGEDLCGAAS